MFGDDDEDEMVPGEKAADHDDEPHAGVDAIHHESEENQDFSGEYQHPEQGNNLDQYSASQTGVHSFFCAQSPSVIIPINICEHAFLWKAMYRVLQMVTFLCINKMY